jgi:SAM-dependent methyltransferase
VQPGEESLPLELFARVDESDDALFYREPRLVQHIDEATIAALSRYYGEAIPTGSSVLDLMSSWVSHLPPDLDLREVVGLGMNADELRANPRLTSRVVQDLNRDATLPFQSERFDVVTIAVSVQYLTGPVAVFAEIGRVLKPGGRVIVAMSHRCFPTKAVRAFHVLSAADRVRLVGAYLELAGRFAAPGFFDRSPPQADPLWIVTATAGAGDVRATGQRTPDPV